MMKRLLLFIVFAILAIPGYAQNPAVIGTTEVQFQQGYYALVTLTTTNAVNSPTTLTIPAPTQPSYYNYICSLGFNVSQNGTGTAITNAVTTSTNFNSFALKFSQAGTINTSYDWNAHWGTPLGGCVKSTSPGTATTFVSPAAVAQAAFTWYGTYFQAP